MVTMRDVADAAGVSIATVSRVLNGTRPVNASAQRSVLQAVDHLGYRRNLVASSLRRQRTRSVAAVVPHIANPYFPRLIQAIERGLAADEHQLLIADSQDDPAVERERIAALADRQVDGLLLVPCHERDSAASLEGIALPYVLVDRTIAGLEADRVGSDDVAGMGDVVAHLRASGRRRLVFVGAAPDTSTARQRLEAFRAEVGPDAPVWLGDYSLDWGRQAAGTLLDAAGTDLDGLPDAVVCGNDLVAIGVVRGLRDAGVALPRTVAVTGYDDVGFAEVCDPPLTTVHQPVDAIGEAAVRLLLERAGGADPPARELRLAPELVIRASTAGGGTR
jgi:LacI family transcriptional regulator